MARRPTVIFDFDGVIHSYKSGWQGAAVIPDSPVEGIKEAIADIARYYRIVIVSSRCYQPGGMKAIANWMAKHGIYYDSITDEKPPAIVTIDDRAITFNGKPNILLDQIKHFRPWYQN